MLFIKIIVGSSLETKTMIFNFTHNHQFTTRLSVNNENIEVVDNTKLLGTYITNDLKWHLNTSELIKKANKRLQLLHKISDFGASLSDMKEIYIIFIIFQTRLDIDLMVLFRSTLILKISLTYLTAYYLRKTHYLVTLQMYTGD